MATFILSAAFALILLISISRKGGKIFIFAFSFFIFQFIAALYSLFGADSVENTVFYRYFSADRLSLVMFFVTSLVALIASFSSFLHVRERQKLYFIAFIVLDLLLLGVIFSNNIIVNWVFLEATALAVAAFSNHYRNSEAIETTWKYIFINSVCTVLAFTGILLLGHEISGLNVGFSYPELQSVSSRVSPLFFEISFLLIFISYSSKLEVIPLYTPGIDINHTSPAPASGFISSALVGAAFVSVFRLYKVISPNAEVFDWVKNVLIIVGIISIVCTAICAGRTDNYKRLLSYSTVENCGIVMLGLGIGGIGVFAALVHMLAHMIMKCIAFVQFSVVGKLYRTYRIGKHSEYFKVDPAGAVVIIFALISLMAFPPSVLFRTEMMIFSEMVLSEKLWWILIIIMIMLIAIIYWMFEKTLPLLYKKSSTFKTSAYNLKEKRTIFSTILMIVLISLFVLGWLLPESLTSFLMQIVHV